MNSPKNTDRTAALAAALHAAEREVREIDGIVPAHPDLTLDDAYAIQRALVALYERPVVGLKAALTSRAKQVAMNVTQPGYGTLLDFMKVDGTLRRSELIHPRVEPEIALFFEDLPTDRMLASDEIAVLATGFAPALEVIDSRYKKFKFTAVDVYADNCSSSRFMLGRDVLPLPHPQLELAGVVLEKNGDIVQTGAPAAVLGHPFTSAAFVLNLAIAHGVQLPRRFVLLTGGITEAVPVEVGDVIRCRFGGIGEISLSVTE
ncbi:MAG: 4-oxalocrotonate decarboxylase [Ignavibacteria bacterium]|nr:4-oxalocrotonate decarboxylase [Ignavibacteria bacterium]